jgi:hypothetical protein
MFRVYDYYDAAEVVAQIRGFTVRANVSFRDQVTVPASFINHTLYATCVSVVIRFFVPQPLVLLP